MPRFIRFQCRMTRNGLAAVLMVSWALLLGPSIGSAEPLTETLQAVRQARKDGRFDEAAKQLLELHRGTKDDLSVECVLLARAAKGKLSQVDLAGLLEATEEGLSRSQATKQGLDNRLLVRLSLAGGFLKQSAVVRAASVLRKGLDEIDQVDADLGSANVSATVKLTLQVAYRLLAERQAEESESTYLLIVGLLESSERQSDASDENLALAMLGLGWATALQQERIVDAADRLARFVDRFPSHPDAPRAAAYRIQCLQQIGQQSGDLSSVAIATERFLNRWPGDQQAGEIAKIAIDSSQTPGKALDSWISGAANHGPQSVQLSKRYLLKFAAELDPEAFRRVTELLLAEDAKGQGTADLLAGLEAAGQGDAAIGLLAELFSDGTQNTPPMAIEAGGRWAARAGHWPELAGAAKALTDQLGSEPENESIRHLTEHTVRLFAEALTQVGNRSDALAWWEYLVDERDSRDFPTLLRCAEVAVAQDSIAGARDRVDRLRRHFVSEDGAESRRYWVDLLDADLAIRSIDFGKARSLFESVVRCPHADAAVQGRAQWMIGETYFMQKDFANAINAYRMVDGIDSSGTYAAAALVQAGKSFEQLGRTQEAGICYGTLLSRFADSPHASEAHRRMAALATDNGSETSRTDAVKR